MIPEFWTRFVIVVDSRPAILPSALQSQLSWSRDLPLDVIITRGYFNHPVDSQHERTQVMSIMKTLINPHIHRFQTLHVDVMFSSSLPPFPDGFRGTASILEVLRFEGREDNGSSPDDPESVTSTEQQFPALCYLAIDGRNYYNACKGDSRLALKCTEIMYLTVSHYLPLPGESFLASEFLRPITMMKDLEDLDMTDLTLHPSPLPLPTSTVRPPLTDLRIREVRNSQSLAEIFDVLGHASDISLTHSAIGDAGTFNPDGRLSLQDIDADQDLVPLLRNWEGYCLTVKDCPSFNDTVLHVMAPGEDGSHNCAHYMTQLVILDCSNFSVAALRQLVRAKLNAGHELQTLAVDGDAPVISDEDHEWLCESIDDFYYTLTAVA
jgi:hypothetical protein